MESEASVILSRPGLGSATNPSRTTRTESTAVFVGRASFHMVPAGRLLEEPARESAESRGPADSGAEEARHEIVAALRAEARALRAESEARVAAATAATAAAGQVTPLVIGMATGEQTPLIEGRMARPEPGSDRRGVVLQLLPSVEVTEPIDARARTRGGSANRAHRSAGMSVRTIVVALLAGASLTLTAQAVVRRPGGGTKLKGASDATAAPVAVEKQVPAAAPAPVAPAAEPAPALAVVVEAPAAFVPTVVASTLTMPASNDEADAEPMATPRKRLNARAPSPSRPKGAAPARAQRSATGAAPMRAASATTWIDPFVTASPGEPAVAARPSASARHVKAGRAKAGTRSVAAADWVDPFVE